MAEENAVTVFKQENKEARDQLRNALVELSANRKEMVSGFVVESMQETADDFSANMMNKMKLVKPPYDPCKMGVIAESSTILPQCIEAMVRNCDGFGYQLMYIGEGDPHDNTEAQAEKETLENFFDRVNETESFRSVREKVRRDQETYGFGFMEAIRDQEGVLAILYYMDAKFVRVQALQEESVEVPVMVVRNGKEMTINVKRRFRRYVQVVKKGKVRYFKEWGDPRTMDAVTGEYTDSPEDEATEVMHFRIGNDTYGIPRWSGQVLTALGMHSADFVNWDLFENQVVPPLAVMVSGGLLTGESIKDIKRVLVQKKGVENFNKVLILEAQSDGNLTDKAGVKIELKELSQARKEDGMFTIYLEKGEGRVRSSFRLPPMYVGRAENYSKSTADSARMVAEEQIFIPERGVFDEFVNVNIVPQFGTKLWKFFSTGPQLITGEEVTKAFKAFSDAGVFTINEGIRLANRLLKMDITPYDKQWGDYPVAVVLELAKLGMLADIDEISVMTGDLTTLLDEKDADDPEKAAKLFTAMNQVRAILANVSATREKNNDENIEAVR